MELEHLYNLSGPEQIIVLIAVTAMVIAVTAALYGGAARSRMAAQHSLMKDRVDSLWKDVNAWQADQFSDPVGSASGEPDHTAGKRFATEKAAYDAIWPLVWSLHDKLGMFLRAVDSEDTSGEYRLDARDAALEARRGLNSVRPFCDGDIEALTTQLIDCHIKAHLAACHLMDLRKDALASSSNHEQAVQKEKFHLLYDGQAKELLNQLVVLIRRRMLR